ncbi:5-carboxymethyl-2-hydroxymuconate isomerase [Paraburkholderia sp. Cy-641]|uniref:fumarylacetoacetate hydrolase family protein n=1 Tax=Paraburkholderia sp. Cy-641 TaxID=2608337 RepID=UPI0014204C80|nr:fumarylacetoacetate hydrolase family protein [Paraburkholderia sp. Cy-641]NIF78373.1 5-carboxymethyl-2-hydroxymuconate isomerase [Paraburkholderia sp. Cy-641]
MKLASFRVDGRASYGVVEEDRIIDVAPISSEVGATLRHALALGRLPDIARWALESTEHLPLDQVDMLPVISDPGKILCVGINYHAHVKETGRALPSHPMIFTRFADSQCGHLGALVCPPESTQLDFEGELAVVIGREAHRVPSAYALEYVAGYACYNDGSIRDWQRHTTQFTPGKNFPSTGAFGPWLVTADEIPDPSNLALTTRLNGTVMQRANTSDLIFGIAELIEYCSSFTPLRPGDVIITGTPGGVGAFREPPVWLKKGDTIEIEISQIGTLVNTVANHPC